MTQPKETSVPVDAVTYSDSMKPFLFKGVEYSIYYTRRDVEQPSGNCDTCGRSAVNEIYYEPVQILRSDTMQEIPLSSSRGIEITKAFRKEFRQAICAICEHKLGEDIAIEAGRTEPGYPAEAEEL